MDATWLAAFTAMLATIGAGVWNLIKRSDEKAKARDDAVADLLKERVKSYQELLDEKQAELEAERRAHRRTKRAAGKWREQLLQNDITPDPREWPDTEEAMP